MFSMCSGKRQATSGRLEKPANRATDPFTILGHKLGRRSVSYQLYGMHILAELHLDNRRNILSCIFYSPFEGAGRRRSGRISVLSRHRRRGRLYTQVVVGSHQLYARKPC